MEANDGFVFLAKVNFKSGHSIYSVFNKLVLQEGYIAFICANYPIVERIKSRIDKDIEIGIIGDLDPKTIESTVFIDCWAIEDLITTNELEVEVKRLQMAMKRI